MHSNRILYTLPEYQAKLRNGYKSLGLILKENSSGKTYLFRPIPSTAWLPEGRKKYYGKLLKRKDSIKKHNHYSFCTLTYDAKLYTNVQVAKRLKSDIDKFFKRLDYHNGRPEYFYVIELTENFYPHIHLIFDQYIHKSKIFMSWKEVTGSTAIKIQGLHYEKALFYCLKYITKAKKQSEAMFSFLFSHVDRIWSCSRNFFHKFDDSLKKWFCIAFFKDDFTFQSDIWADVDHDIQTRELTDFELNDILGYAALNDQLWYYQSTTGVNND